MISRWFLELHLESIWIYTACNFPRWTLVKIKCVFLRWFLRMLCSVCIHIIYVYPHTYIYLCTSQCPARFKYIATNCQLWCNQCIFFLQAYINAPMLPLSVEGWSWRQRYFGVRNNCECRTCRGGKHWRSKWMHLSPVVTWRLSFIRYVFAGCRSIQISWLDSHTALKKHLGMAQNVAPKDSLLPFQRTHSWRIWLL